VRPLAALSLVLVCACACAPPLAAQADAYRFEITSAGDSLFSFPTREQQWIRVGLRGIAVDPTRHDALVARFEIVRVDHGWATALITGQTTHVTSEHVALLQRPPTPWWKQRTFWLGTLLGAAIGAVVAGR
jgi:hypothetical protein